MVLASQALLFAQRDYGREVDLGIVATDGSRSNATVTAAAGGASFPFPIETSYSDCFVDNRNDALYAHENFFSVTVNPMAIDHDNFVSNIQSHSTNFEE